MNSYSLGFVFDNMRRTALVRKKGGPGDQAGKLNGFGGKLNEGEHPLVCMAREYREESGFDWFDWRFFSRESDETSYEIFIYAALVPTIPDVDYFTGREAVEVYRIRDLRSMPVNQFVTDTYLWLHRCGYVIECSFPGIKLA